MYRKDLCSKKVKKAISVAQAVMRVSEEAKKAEESKNNKKITSRGF